MAKANPRKTNRSSPVAGPVPRAIPVAGNSEEYRQYQQVVETVRTRANFGLEDLQGQLVRQPPEFVVKVVNELASQGWLIRELGGDWKSARYRWNMDRGEFDLDRWLGRNSQGFRIAETPPHDRPRERLLKMGAENLMTSELLAILIRAGRAGESAVQAGVKLANQYADKLDRLPAASPAELKATSSVVATTAYCQIMAGIELGRRIAELALSPGERVRIGSADDAIQFCETHFRRLVMDGSKEEFHVVTLDTKHCVIDTHQVSVGILDASLVHPREVFHVAIKDSASAILLVHNHPSGDPTPSREDWQVTARLQAAGQQLGIEVLDHIVLGAFRSVSMGQGRD
ncbi:MAG: DNA repair protein RadC [Mariniblastus sp.]|nr:DNA repair protein RadC [Mariniblastus sp.]